MCGQRADCKVTVATAKCCVQFYTHTHSLSLSLSLSLSHSLALCRPEVKQWELRHVWGLVRLSSRGALEWPRTSCPPGSLSTLRLLQDTQLQKGDLQGLLCPELGSVPFPQPSSSSESQAPPSFQRGRHMGRECQGLGASV